MHSRKRLTSLTCLAATFFTSVGGGSASFGSNAVAAVDDEQVAYRDLIRDLIERKDPSSWPHSQEVLDRLLRLGIKREWRFYETLCHMYGEVPHAFSLEDDLLEGEDTAVALSGAAAANMQVAKGSMRGMIHKSTLNGFITVRDHPLIPDPYIRGLQTKHEPDLRKYAEEIYNVIFGDGKGKYDWLERHELWYRHKPSSKTTFVESLVAIAQGRMKFEDAPAHELKRGPLFDSIEELFVQKRHKMAILERYRPEGRGEHETLETDENGYGGPWDMPCAEPLWRNIYPDCHVGPPYGHGPSCRKAIVDNLITDEEAEVLIAMIDRQTERLDRIGYVTMMVIDEKRRAMIGEEAYEVSWRLFERLHGIIADVLNATEVYHAGSLLSRKDVEQVLDGKQFDATYDSHEAHSDKANHGSYDYGALLYLSTQNEHFGGGELVFNDPDMDRWVVPKRGRTVFYTGGLEALHSIRPVTWGKRYLLSIWYTCNPHHASIALGELGERKLPTSRGSQTWGKFNVGLLGT